MDAVDAKSKASGQEQRTVQGQPTMSNSMPQRGECFFGPINPLSLLLWVILKSSTVPGPGHEIPADKIYRPEDVNRDDPNINVIELPPQKKPSFKEQILGMHVCWLSSHYIHWSWRAGYARVCYSIFVNERKFICVTNGFDLKVIRGTVSVNVVNNMTN